MTTRPPREERDPDRLTWWDTTWRVGAALLLGLFVWTLTAVMTFPSPEEELSDTFRTFWLVLVDPVIGLVATGLMILRRRWPVPIAVVTTLLTGVSVFAAGAQSIVLVSLATRRRWREIVPVTALSVLVSLVNTRVVYPDPEPLPLWVEAVLTALIIIVTVAIGYAIGSRRALVASWVDRARSAEAEQSARVAQAQTAERSRIAREMHDVLAHRISLVTMHSGLLTYRPDLPEGERRKAIAAIDTNARAALTDLREVLGVLRDEDGSGSLRPQHTLRDLPELLDDARAAGTRLTLDDGGVDLSSVPESTGRTAYRVVQEGLTNARKHAPGAAVTVTLSGRPGGVLRVEVVNPRAVGSQPAVPGSGLGLLGLAERVELAGGEMRHGWDTGDQHRLVVSLPWAT
ncbi:sensor histidine kinase [Janibacter anophelis]|uniref:sensor histidine kinase n=1 Tax=Janibacter anophelis TaxID=319054 RepID=UPI0013B059D6|nr:histidine kinase [Janibacter anophelis]